VSGLEDLDQIWRLFEGRATGAPEDAAHWVRVYRELVWAAEAMLEDTRQLPADQPDQAGAARALVRRVASLRSRFGYWEAILKQPQGSDPK